MHQCHHNVQGFGAWKSYYILPIHSRLDDVFLFHRSIGSLRYSSLFSNALSPQTHPCHGSAISRIPTSPTRRRTAPATMLGTHFSISGGVSRIEGLGCRVDRDFSMRAVGRWSLSAKTIMQFIIQTCYYGHVFVISFPSGANAWAARLGGRRKQFTLACPTLIQKTKCSERCQVAMDRVSCPCLHRREAERRGVETTVGVERGEGWKVQGAERRTRREEERCGMGRERGERRERTER